MNNQLPMHPTYTLPGVMHYLQTEFTRNERDRISWELERSEMKARIAQLEGENKDLRYRLMKLDPNSEPEIFRPLGGNGVSPLVKSKAAVQENVKEIIYLFKSPNLGSQIESLNEKRDPIHELEKLGFNQNRDNSSQQPFINHKGDADLRDIGIHETNIVEESLQHEDLAGSKIDERSDAGTIVVGSDNEYKETEDTADFPRRHRSSSLFTSERVKPLEGEEEEKLPREASISFVQGTSDRSAIVRLKAHGSQVLVYSRSGELNRRCIDQSLNWQDQCEKFEGLSSKLLDIFWLDNEKFLTLDNEGLKLWETSMQKRPIAHITLFGETLQYDQVNSWDFKNNCLLLALNSKLYLSEILISTDPPTISLAKKHYFNTNRHVLDAKFGMTEKSLIIFNRNSEEVDIYNFQGKLLQKIDMKKFLPSQNQFDSNASLYLNKMSSKLLILLEELLLVYSFDQKKVVLKRSLGSQPTSLIFNSPRDDIVLAYNDGYVEVRNIKAFDSIIKRYCHVNDELELDENTQSLMHSGLRPMDRNPIILQNTEINNHKIIISADDSGRIRLNEIQELEERNYE